MPGNAGLRPRATQVGAHTDEGPRPSRVDATLKALSQVIGRVSAREELFLETCRILVELGGFLRARISWHNPVTRHLEPVAEWDAEAGAGGASHLEQEGVSDTTGELVLSEGRVRVRDEPESPARSENPEARIGSRYRASAVVPIWMQRRVLGTLGAYADAPGSFGDEEIALLERAAGDVSIALENQVLQYRHQRAEEEARSERLFSETMIESLPGILYFYDERGRFLRWNRNFETVSGYTTDEIAGMHPLDFFSSEHRATLEQRIGEVFERGGSSAEAPFRSKDGSVTPYYFTGRRVDFNGTPCLVGVGIDISEREQALQALRESEERFNAFMESTPAIAWITDSEGRHLYMNRAWDEAFGLRGEEWLGKTAFDLVHAETAERIRQGDSKVLQENRALVIPEEAGHLRGKPFYWHCVKFPVEGSSGERFVGGIAIDITARKQAEAARRTSEGRYQALFENAPDGIVIADPESVYVDANPSVCKLLGYTRDELIGLHASDIVAPSQVASIEPTLNGIRSGGGHHREWRFRRKDGSSFDAEVIAARMPDGNLMGMIRDITARKEAEAALRELNQTLEQKVAERTAELRDALAQAEAADRVKSSFLATMSHELRTPLNSIIGFTGIMLQELAGPLSPEQSKQLGMVRSSARHLLELINDVLDLSKIEASQLEVQTEAVDLPALLERVIASIRPLAERKRLTLDLRCAPEVGSIASDRRRLEQILLNLLNNAVKFTERGGVTLVVEVVAGYVSPQGSVRGRVVRFRVIDTGIGIRPEDLAVLFQPFHQIDSGLTRKHEGTGLGLAICRRLAALLGGEVWATSEGTGGSEFTLVLPVGGSEQR
jgi:PAS domain S-box-containing protein